MSIPLLVKRSQGFTRKTLLPFLLKRRFTQKTVNLPQFRNNQAKQLLSLDPHGNNDLFMASRLSVMYAKLLDDKQHRVLLESVRGHRQSMAAWLVIEFSRRRLVG